MTQVLPRPSAQLPRPTAIKPLPANSVVRSPRLAPPRAFRPPLTKVPPRAGVPGLLPLPLQLRKLDPPDVRQQRNLEQVQRISRQIRRFRDLFPRNNSRPSDPTNLFGPNLEPIPARNPNSDNALRPTPEIPQPFDNPQPGQGPLDMPGYGVQASIFSVNNGFTVNYDNLIAYEVLDENLAFPGSFNFRATFSPFGDPCLTPIVATIAADLSTFIVTAAGSADQGTLNCSGPEPPFIDLPGTPIDSIPPDLFRPAREAPPGIPRPLDIPELPFPLPDFPPLRKPSLPPVGPTIPDLEPATPPGPLIPDVPLSPDGFPSPADRRNDDDTFDLGRPVGRRPTDNRPPFRPPNPLDLPDPELRKNRRKPPPDFDLCSDECFQEATSQAIVQVIEKENLEQLIGELTFGADLGGQYSATLPENTVLVSVRVVAASSNITTYGVYGDGEKMAQFGTLAVVVDGKPLQSYTLNRFEASRVQIPRIESGQFQIMILPSFPCVVEVVDLGYRYKLVKIENANLLPTVNAANFI